MSNLPQAQLIKKYDIKLIYPIIILYDADTLGYDKSIEKAIEYIRKNHSPKAFTISIPYSIYFIWLPVGKVRDIKVKVIEWIESKKQLL